MSEPEDLIRFHLTEALHAFDRYGSSEARYHLREADELLKTTGVSRKAPTERSKPTKGQTDV